MSEQLSNIISQVQNYFDKTDLNSEWAHCGIIDFSFDYQNILESFSFIRTPIPDMLKEALWLEVMDLDFLPFSNYMVAVLQRINKKVVQVLTENRGSQSRLPESWRSFDNFTRQIAFAWSDHLEKRAERMDYAQYAEMSIAREEGLMAWSNFNKIMRNLVSDIYYVTGYKHIFVLPVIYPVANSKVERAFNQLLRKARSPHLLVIRSLESF